MTSDRIEIKERLSLSEIKSVERLIGRAFLFDQHHPIDEHRYLDLVQGGRKAIKAVIAWDEGNREAHTLEETVMNVQADREALVYAQVSKGNRGNDWAIDLVVDPEERSGPGRLAESVLIEARSLISKEGGGHVHLWVAKPTDWHLSIAEQAGFSKGRDLLQMRIALPILPNDLQNPDGKLPMGSDLFGPGFELREFLPGKDEAEWLDLNNRAFSWHPEQGGWTERTLLEREAESWFDPRGFFLLFSTNKLVGFCWTKVHPKDPVHGDNEDLGEIYVIGVDPAIQHEGLGRRLVVHSLNWLSAGKGIRTGMLYVDASNDKAVRMYQSLGFTTDHLDRAFTADV